MNILFQYAVKFVCGKSDGRVVAPGSYWTAINVHNPANRRIVLRKKFAVALPNEKAGPVYPSPSSFFEAILGPDEALEIDCEDILQHLPPQVDALLKGFAVIECEVELDVVAVYTAAGADGQVETLDTERVSPRRVEVGLPDLVPVPDEQGSFCRRDNLILTVRVRNQGSATAGPSVTRVDFGPYGSADMPTPPLPPGASVDLNFPIPPGCFDPNCEFRIIADAAGAVAESDEGNNFASGVCFG